MTKRYWMGLAVLLAACAQTPEQASEPEVAAVAPAASKPVHTCPPSDGLQPLTGPLEGLAIRDQAAISSINRIHFQQLALEIPAALGLSQLNQLKAVTSGEIGDVWRQRFAWVPVTAGASQLLVTLHMGNSADNRPLLTAELRRTAGGELLVAECRRELILPGNPGPWWSADARPALKTALRSWASTTASVIASSP